MLLSGALHRGRFVFGVWFVFLAGCASGSRREISGAFPEAGTPSDAGAPDTLPKGPRGDAAADRVTFDGPPLCDESSLEVGRTIPNVLIVLDRSNSMASDGHWDPVRSAIASVTAAIDTGIAFGLSIFPNTVDPTACAGTNNQCAPAGAPLVECATGRATDIASLLETTATCGGTPIASSLDAARAYLEPLAASTTRPSYVLLATDGAPNCDPTLNGLSCRCTMGFSCLANPTNCLDDGHTNEIIDQLATSDIKLFVVGIAASAWRDVLDTMASRGGTGAAIMADDSASMESAFAGIAGSVISCDWELGAPDSSADPNLVNFYFDSEQVPKDTSGDCDAGWAWTDEARTRVRFCGTYCDRLTRGEIANVQATYGCPSIS